MGLRELFTILVHLERANDSLRNNAWVRITYLLLFRSRACLIAVNETWKKCWGVNVNGGTSHDFFIVNLRDTKWKKSVVCSSWTNKPTLPSLSPNPFMSKRNKKHRILVKDLINNNFLKANAKKQRWSCKQCKEDILFYRIFRKVLPFFNKLVVCNTLMKKGSAFQNIG